MIRKQLKQIDCWSNGYPKFYGFVYEIYKDKDKPPWAQRPTGVLVFYLIPFDYVVRFFRHLRLTILIMIAWVPVFRINRFIGFRRWADDKWVDILIFKDRQVTKIRRKNQR